MKGVFDTSCSRDLSLIETCNEFISRYKKSRAENGSAIPMLTSACPGQEKFSIPVKFCSVSFYVKTWDVYLELFGMPAIN